jgi:hypothetical protein
MNCLQNSNMVAGNLTDALGTGEAIDKFRAAVGLHAFDIIDAGRDRRAR